jgi:hypothetical protein
MVVVVGLGSSAPVPAQTVVVPNIYGTAEGPGSTPLPIHIENNPWTLQLVYHENQLTGLVGTEITGIAYRRSATAGGGYPLQSTTWSNYVVRMGPSVAPGVATGTFATNFTASPTEVRSGTVTVPPFAWPNNGPPGPNPWGTEITFNTPYVYTGGNLAMLITHPGSDNPNIGDALIDTTGMASPGLGTNYAYFAGQGFDTLAGASSVFLPVVRFTSQPVPEPATGLLACAVVAGFVAAARRWRRRGDPTTHPDLEPPGSYAEPR